MSDVFERNLQRLMGRYEPKLPSSEFRQDLRRRLLAQPSGRTQWTPYLLGAAAAAAVVLFLLLRTDPLAPANGPGLVADDGSKKGAGADENQGPQQVATPDGGTDRRPIDNELVEQGPQRAEIGANLPEGMARLITRVTGPNGEVIEDYRLWTRTQRPLPEVSDPRALQVSSDRGEAQVDLSAESYKVVVEAPPYATWTVSGLQLTSGQVHPLDIQLEEGHELRGHVIDAETGAPIEGALVLAEADLAYEVLDLAGEDLARDNLGSPPLASVRTDSAGAFHLPSLSSGAHGLRACAPGYAPAWSEDFKLPGAAPLLLELRRGGRVHGVVQDASGAPLTGARVVISKITIDRPVRVMTYGGAITDDQGVYSVENMSPGYFVALVLRADDTTHAIRQGKVAEGESTRIDFLPSEPRGFVEGTLTDAEGVPLADYKVSLSPEENAHFEGWVGTSTDAKGRFRLPPVQAGHYALLVSPSFPSVVRWGSVEVPERGSVRVDLTLEPTRIEGTLKVPEGESMQGLSLVLLGESSSGELTFFGRQEPTPAGHYSFEGLPRGQYLLALLSLNPRLGSLPARKVELTDGIVEDFELAPGGGLDLSVQDKRGEPVAGEWVYIHDEAGTPFGFDASPKTRADGTLPMPTLAPGMWEISVRGRSELIEVRAGRVTEHVFVLRD